MQLLWNTLALWANTTFVSPMPLLANYPILEPCPAQEMPTGGEITANTAHAACGAPLHAAAGCTIEQCCMQGSALGPMQFILFIKPAWWDKGSPTARSQMRQNWEEWLMHQMAVPLFRGTLTACRNGPIGISWISTKENAKVSVFAAQIHPEEGFPSLPGLYGNCTSTQKAAIRKPDQSPIKFVHLRVPASTHTYSMLLSSCHCCPQTRHPLSDNLLENTVKHITKPVWFGGNCAFNRTGTAGVGMSSRGIMEKEGSTLNWYCCLKCHKSLVFIDLFLGFQPLISSTYWLLPQRSEGVFWVSYQLWPACDCQAMRDLMWYED